MFESIALLIVGVGVPLAGWIAKQVSGTKKLTRCQVLASGKRLAWQVVEAAKKLPGGPMTKEAMTDAAQVALLRWASAEGLKLTPAELKAAREGWALLSQAAKGKPAAKRK